MKNSTYLIYTVLLLFVAVSCDNNTLSPEQKESASIDFASMEDGLITLESGTVVKKEGDTFYWQGDIILSQTQLETLNKHGKIIIEDPEKTANENRVRVHPVYNVPLKTGEDTTTVPRSFGIYPTPYNMWAMVRFVYADDLTSYRKYIIRQALEHWEARTNVRFYNATGEPTVDPVYGFEYPYVEFVNSNVNRSSVGRIGGRQIVELVAFPALSSAIHEIGHAIGLLHEHTRYDRNNYININFSNIVDSKEYNFERRTSNYYAVGSIDYNSVMMYDSYISDPSFVIDTSIPVMTKKSDGSTWAGGTVLSGSDRRWANSIYIPYIARSDTYRELDEVVYKPDNTIMSESERLSLQAQLNNGDPTPPDCCRLPNNF